MRPYLCLLLAVTVFLIGSYSIGQDVKPISPPKPNFILRIPIYDSAAAIGNFYDKGLLRRVLKLSPEKAVKVIESQGIRVFKIGENSEGLFSFLESAPIELNGYISAFTNDRDILGMFLPKNWKGMEALKKTNVILVREDASMLVLAHEFAHFLIAERTQLKFSQKYPDFSFDDIINLESEMKDSLIDLSAAIDEKKNVGKRTKVFLNNYFKYVEAYKVKMYNALEESLADYVILSAIGELGSRVDYDQDELYRHLLYAQQNAESAKKSAEALASFAKEMQQAFLLLPHRTGPLNYLKLHSEALESMIYEHNTLMTYFYFSVNLLEEKINL